MLYFNNENKSEDIKNFIINDNQIIEIKGYYDKLIKLIE